MKVEITLDGPEPTVKRILHAAFAEAQRIGAEEEQVAPESWFAGVPQYRRSHAIPDGLTGEIRLVSQ